MPFALRPLPHAMPKVQHYRFEFEVDVPRAQLWRFVADTNRLNRIAGLFNVRFHYKPLETGGSIVRATAKSMGLKLKWTERSPEWVEPRWWKMTRDFDVGPITRLISRCELEDIPGKKPGTTGTRIIQSFEATPRGVLGALVARVAVGVQTKQAFTRAYEHVEDWARNAEHWPSTGAEKPAATPAVEATLVDRLLPLGEKLKLSPVAKLLKDYLASEPDSELGALYPYRLADRWKAARKDVLVLLLHATRAGLFDMNWSILCPSCRRSKDLAKTLNELAQSGHCETCNIDFGVDFDRSVEVTFSPAPMGLGTKPAEYCHSGPRNTPHRVAACVLNDGRPQSGRSTLTFDATPGKHQFRSPQAKGAVFVEFADDADVPANADITIATHGLEGVPDRLRAGEVTLALSCLTNVADTEFLVERAAWADDSATAADVTALDEFRALFGSQVLAPGASFSIRNMTFLFSDLVGSTALYEKIGDANAFALVRDHFDLLHEIYRHHDGTLVKTIGDAVMAAFRRPQDAVAAGLEMHDRIGAIVCQQTDRPLQLRIGVHGGPCITMEANGILDYFGTTVNTAARFQSAANAGELALSEAVLASPDVQAVLAARRAGHAVEMTTEQAQLKGITGVMKLSRIKTDTGRVTVQTKQLSDSDMLAVTAPFTADPGSDPTSAPPPSAEPADDA